MANKETVRRFIAAAVCDFVGHLDSLDSPIIVGGSYPKDRLIEQLQRWCESRNFNVADADAVGWTVACQTGSLKTPGPMPAKEGETDAST